MIGWRRIMRLWVTVMIGLLCLGHGTDRSLAASRQHATNAKEEVVTFQNGTVTLTGTLITPMTAGPYPAVVIVHGAHPSKRGPYSGFAMEVFAQHGVAALIYDKRGYGQSSGNADETSLYDLAEDALAAVRYLQSRTDIDPKRIGLQGDSQAGWVIPIAAARTKDIAFIVMVAASGVSPAQQEVFSMENKLRSARLSERVVDTGRKARKLMDDYAYAVYQGRLPATDDLQKVISLRTDHDPVPVLEQITQPVLIILGEADPFVPTEHSATVFDKALRKAGNHDYTIIVYPGANHGIQVPTTNAQDETIFKYVDGYRDTMTNWVVAHMRENAASGKGIQGPASDESAAFGEAGIYGKPLWYGTATVQLMLIVLFALVFLSASLGLTISPIVLRQARRDRTMPAPVGARRARLIGIVTSTLNLIVLAGVVAFIAVLLLSDDEVDVPVLFNLLPVLSFLTTLLTIGMSGFALLA